MGKIIPPRRPLPLHISRLIFISHNSFAASLHLRPSTPTDRGLLLLLLLLLLLVVVVLLLLRCRSRPRTALQPRHIAPVQRRIPT